MPSTVVPQPTSSWIGPMSTPNEYSHDPYEVIVTMPRTGTPERPDRLFIGQMLSRL